MKRLFAIFALLALSVPAGAVQQPSRLKTWTNEVLTAADLNAEFDQIHTYIEAQLLGSANSWTVANGDSAFFNGQKTSIDSAYINKVFEIAGSTSRIGELATPIDSVYVFHLDVADSLRIRAGARATIAWAKADTLQTFLMVGGQRATVTYIDPDTLNGSFVIPGTPTWTIGTSLTFSGTIANLGTVTTADINGGTVDGAVIGGASAAAGTFTALTATGNVSHNGGTYIFNEDSADLDARWESNDLTHALFLNSGNNNWGFGADPGTSAFRIYATYTAANSTAPGYYFHGAATTGTDSQPVGKFKQDYASSTGEAMALESDTPNTGALTLFSAGHTLTAKNRVDGGVKTGIADDAATTLFNVATNGMCLVQARNNSTGAILGAAFVSFRTAEATKSCVLLDTGGSITFAASTTDLAGTTGADGAITVSAHDSILEVENRSAVSADFYITFFW